MPRLFILLLVLVACATGRHHYLSPDAMEFAELERDVMRSQKLLAAKDKTIEKLMGRLRAAHEAVDPTGNDPYGDGCPCVTGPPSKTCCKGTT